jgi:hypothetical protein
VTEQYSPMEQSMLQAGVAVDEPVYEDYFGFDDNRTWYFPDGKQYITYKVMNEGQKSNFQKKTNKDISIKRTTGDASISTDPAAERHALLNESVTGWHVVKRNQKTGQFEPVPFSIGSPGSEFNKWLLSANPRLVEALELEVRRANPWLQGDMSIEDVDQEIERLTDLRADLVKQQEGKGVS